ncbi:MAG: hypothetical protein EAZ99_00840 [Alphaproteobacteria bacterium]|nr:hypothetical protein [Alphaproteobacteria bacterium]TAD91908.1 MAG: hypothetical protein EAZ99_00840 [Alphaproteobacteria bacterium]
MVGIYMNHALSDAQRRTQLFSGELLVYGASPASKALAQHAADMVRAAFHPLDPETAQYHLEVPRFIEIVGPLKKEFTNGQRTKDLVRAVLAEYGCDPDDTWFDVPRLRVVPSDGYLAAGVSYAYKMHRDTWYSSPHAQINWWMPVMDVVPRRAMAFLGEYWDRPILNNSAEFDYGEWCAFGRTAAMQQTTVDTRKHPVPMEEASGASEFRIAGTSGDLLMFSAAHLHATCPNDSGKTRFSMDFRTVSLADLTNGSGAPNVDCRSTGSTLGDFLSMKDLSPLPDGVVATSTSTKELVDA